MVVATHFNQQHNYRSLLRSSGVRIALIFTAATVGLLLAVNIVVSQRSSQLFWAPIPTQSAETKDIRYAGNQPISNQNVTLGFSHRFHMTLVWITVVGICAALALGLALGYVFIVRPLGRLQAAIAQLKARRFEVIQPTGVAEFDAVVADFNDLVAELQRAEELRKQLISDTSHELKTPIQSLILQLQGMRDGLLPTNPEHFEQLLVRTHTLDEVSEQLQDYARLRSSLVRVQPTSQRLLPLVRAVAKQFADECTQYGVHVTYDIPPGHTVVCDPILFKRLLSNLFRNTLTHARAHTIAIQADGTHITFSDDGIGIPTEHLPHIFERFYQVKEKNKSGLGLGLGIVRDIAEAHQWEISVQSTKGKGLTIVIIHRPL
jgi:two-component system sensor histidine kinase BaeS